MAANPNDVITVSEFRVVTKVNTLGVSKVVTITESVSLYVSPVVTASVFDAVTVTDVDTMFLVTRNISVSDSVSISDFLIAIAVSNFTYYVDKSDIIYVFDCFGNPADMVRLVGPDEVVTVSETIENTHPRPAWRDRPDSII